MKKNSALVFEIAYCTNQGNLGYVVLMIFVQNKNVFQSKVYHPHYTYM